MVETGVGGSDQEAGCREQRGRENGMENQKSLEAQLRGDLHHVTRQWESKAMVQGRGAFQGPKEERWEQWRRRREHLGR